MKQIYTRTVFNDCALEIGQTRIPANLVFLRINDFDVIIGMDWLSEYRVVLDGFNKVVRINL